MPKSKSMKLTAFIVSSALNILAVIGVTIAIMAPAQTEFDVAPLGEVFDA